MTSSFSRPPFGGHEKFVFRQGWLKKGIELLKGLHDLSPHNKAWLRAKALPVEQDTAYLEGCRQKVIKVVYNLYPGETYVHARRPPRLHRPSLPDWGRLGA